MERPSEDALARRRDELQRLVFGTPGGLPDESAAELDAIERELAGGEGERAAGGEGVEGRRGRLPATGRGDAASAPRQPTRRRILRLSATLIVSAVLIVAGIAAIQPVRELLSPARGLEVFDRALTPEDRELAGLIARSSGLPASVADTLRPVGRVFGYDFWVFLRDDEVCLTSKREFWFDWVADCAPLARFEASDAGLSRSIRGDAIRDTARPRRIREDDVVTVTWGPRSIEVEWYVEPAS
jgi:hypothetical protein